MRKILLLVGAVCLIAGQANAVAPVGCKSSGLLASNAHSHIATVPVTIYSITLTPTAANGFANIVDTKGPRVCSDGAGKEYISKDKTVADPRSATSANTIHLTYPEGLSITGNLFVDRQAAEVEITYKE